MAVPQRWLLLDTDTHDLVAIHTDGSEQISVVSFSPGEPPAGGASEAGVGEHSKAWEGRGEGGAWERRGRSLGASSWPPPPPPDGAYLAVGSHDNLVYVYTVDQGGRKVSRLGKCSVSGQRPPSPRRHPAQGPQN